MKELSPQYLSEFCTELALLVRAGVPIGEGLQIMRDDDNDKFSWQLLDNLCKTMESDTLLSCSIRASGCFPSYFLNVICLGEASGKLDEALSSLATFYERRAILAENIKRAIIYPLSLIGLMTAVVVVIVTQVLPIFNSVFNQVGVQMSSTAISLLNFGEWLSSASTVILIIIIALILIGFLIYKIPFTKSAFSRHFEKHFGNRGVLRRISISRFAMAMSMAVSSGLNPEQAVSLAGEVCSSSYNMGKKISQCKEFLEQGNSLEKSLLKSHIFSSRDSRLLALGVKTGSTDTVMSEIARRGEEKTIDELDEALRKVEPTLVIIISIVVGLILFSVMLPLMGIMSSLG